MNVLRCMALLYWQFINKVILGLHQPKCEEAKGGRGGEGGRDRTGEKGSGTKDEITFVKGWEMGGTRKIILCKLYCID